MAKKPVSPAASSKKSAPAPKVVAKAPAAAAPVVASTPVRNSPVPNAAKAPAPVAAVSKKEITHGDIAKRAYEIYASGQGGSEFDNWCRAERELRGGL